MLPEGAVGMLEAARTARRLREPFAIVVKTKVPAVPFRLSAIVVTLDNA